MVTPDRILPNFTSLEVADSLENLSLDSQSKTTKNPEPVKQDFYSDNGSNMYPQTYGYMTYAPYSISRQLHALQEYYYPSPYYQPPLQASQANATQIDVSSYGVADQSSLSAETNKGNSGTLSNGGSGSLKSTFKSSSLNPNPFYKGGLSQGYQDPRFSYDGIQSPIPWLDMSMSSNGQSENAANSRYPSYMNNLSSGRNQNLHAYSHPMNMHNGRHSSGVGQAYGYMNHMYPNNMTYGYGNSIRGGSGFGSYGYDPRKKGLGWYNVGNNNKSRFRGYGKENIDGFNELNKGPRVKGYKSKDGSETATLAVKDQNHSVTTTSNDENIVSLAPDMEQYNKEDFPESYSDAKFFVIKSYSEDDIHKSIKYNVWASTSNGNKKLDAAFLEAKEKHDDCPIFLLFSVNTSGQFVGLAEMVGPVDFNKTLDYWQQDKWTGCFPVKWHIIKDVPNTALRHITLKNNENKPVTNSRDTQEVNLEQGIQILKIFKDHSSKTCILDDFELYENRQKMILEKKAKHWLLQKQVLNEEPNNDAVTDSKENEAIAKETSERTMVASTAEVVKANGPLKSVGVAGAC